MPSDEPSLAPRPASTSEERKLWFDYLAKLNDRNLQRNRESGATSWILLGAAVAIIYNATPQLPQFLTVSGRVKAAAVVLLFEIDILLTIGLFFAYLYIYTTGNKEKRVIPLRLKRFRQVESWIMFIFFLIISISHIWIGLRFVSGAWSRWILLVFGAYWSLCFTLNLFHKVRRARISKKLGVSAPEFHSIVLPSGFRGFIFPVVSLLAGTIPVVGQYFYLKALAQTSVGWLPPLAGASYFVTLCGVLSVLFVRVMSTEPRLAFEALEQAILLEDLTPFEIKSRFVNELLGTSIRDWLNEIIKGIQNAEARLKTFVDSIRERITEIESVDTQYALERQGHARKMLEELETAISEFRFAMEKYEFQLREYSQFEISTEEAELLKRMVADSEIWLEQVKVRGAATRETTSRLKALADPKSNSVLPG